MLQSFFTALFDCMQLKLAAVCDLRISGIQCQEAEGSNLKNQGPRGIRLSCFEMLNFGIAKRGRTRD